MKTVRSHLYLLIAGLTLGACQTSSGGEYVPALAADLSATELEQVRGVLGAATGRAETRLSSGVFNRSHILVLEPALAQTPQGRIATGRTTIRPETFHLLTNGGSCVIEHLRTGNRYPVSFTCRRDN